MKNTLRLLALLALPSALLAEPVAYELDASHSSVGFQVRHLVSKVNGTFGKFSGKIVFDAKNPKASSAEGVIEIASVNTHSEKRDGHLQGDDFFKADKNPQMTFKSTAWKPMGKSGKHEVTGNLTIAGVTKPVTLEVEYAGETLNPMSKQTVAGFSARGVIKRTDWGMSYGAGLIGEDVTITIEAEAVKVEAPKVDATPAAK